jgi:hypothetical protein
MPPLVSVLLPVYNGDQYLAGAISSVLSQTNCEFEMVVVNDGSVDASADIIHQFKDARVRYFEQENRGLPATLNRAIALAGGMYLARQDQDDISFPERLHKQVTFLDANPDVGMVGACAEIWVENEKTGRLLEHPADDASLKFHLLFDNPFVHSSVLIRRCVLDEVGGYTEDSSRQPPEDYELWSRVARKFRVANLPEALLAYREVGGSMSRSGYNPFLCNLMRVSAENIAWASGRESTSPEVVALSRLSHGVYDDIPRGIRFSAMKTVLHEATRRIAEESGAPFGKVETLMQKKLARLHYHLLAYRSGGLLAKFLGGSLGCRARNAASRMWSVWRP